MGKRTEVHPTVVVEEAKPASIAEKSAEYRCRDSVHEAFGAGTLTLAVSTSTRIFLSPRVSRVRLELVSSSDLS
jgi:hypothetical protein